MFLISACWWRRPRSTTFDTYASPFPFIEARPVSDEARFTRTVPALLLLAVIAGLAIQHWYITTEQRSSLIALLFLPPLGMLALGGLVYPPLLWSVGKYGKGMPL